VEKPLRHLIFHITPQETALGQKCWKWHLRQINHYAHFLDGQRIFAIATGPGLLPADQVAPFLPPRSQIISVPNNNELRETYTLPLLLARAFTVEPDDTVLYAHSKGMTWMGHQFEATTRWWSLAMYRHLFSAAALENSRKFPFTGWLKYEGRAPAFPAYSKWHLVGTFWWFKATEIYRRMWWNIYPAKFGAEAYPSGFCESQYVSAPYQIPADQHFTPGTDVARIYSLDFWKQIGIPTGPDADSYDGSPDPVPAESPLLPT
jgi:hypothetical protein